jgi:hypothetical protein
MRHTEPPRVTETERYGDKISVFEHPAYGQVEVTRVTGYQPLYASDFKHQHFLAVRVYHSKFERSLSRDWHHHDIRPIVEFYLSENQWATFVSSVGTGGGVPCTLRYTERDGGLPGLEHRDEAHHYSEEVKERLDRATEGLSATLDELDSLGLPKAKAEKLRDRLRKAIQDITDNVPFVAKSFDEHVETRIEKAKSEIAAHMQNAITRAGIAALSQEPAPLLLFDAAKKEAKR